MDRLLDQFQSLVLQRYAAEPEPVQDVLQAVGQVLDRIEVEHSRERFE